LKIRAEAGDLTQLSYPLLAAGIHQDGELPTLAAKIDQYLGGLIAELRSNGEFRGEAKEARLLYTQGRLPTPRILLVGLGPRETFTYEGARQAGGRAAQEAQRLKLATLATEVFTGPQGELERWAQATAEGAALALYRYTQYRKEEQPQVEALTLYTENPELRGRVERAARVAAALVEGVRVARDVANTPSNDAYPERLAEAARKVAEQHGLTCTVLDVAAMRLEGMGGVLAVGGGSSHPPRFIILEYRGGQGPPVVVVGKAVTFDSGGLSIKPADKMHEMKYDKSGGAAVLGILVAAAKLGLPLNLVGLIPAVENLPGGSAYRPGDVVRLLSGKTAEIINTDAEGRLILADALAYAARYKPRAVIDLATLTGACVVALGAVASGLMGNSDELKAALKRAAEYTGERVWELPLYEEYREQLKSDVADIKNTGGRPAGAITAALFLKESIGDYPWVHLDIAGTAWVQEGTPEKPYQPKGATGVGVRLVVEALREMAKKGVGGGS
jgi:leucyl aminopeptidase